MNRSGKKTAGVVLVMLFLAACAALYVYIYIVPSVSGALTPTAIAYYGQMQTSNPAPCIVMRSERVVYAQQSGNTGYYVSEGAKTRLGVKVADIYPESGSGAGYFMETTGVVSYWYDGLEERFDPSAPESITPEAFASEDSEEQPPAPQEINTSAKEQGDPLYKIVTSDVWYMALLIDEAYIDRYAMGRRIDVDFGDERIDATISRTMRFEGCWVVIAQTHRYYENFAKLRHCDVVIITEDNTGLIIPTTARALQEQEDGSMLEGVYLKTIRGDFLFKRIFVLAENEETGQTLIAEKEFFEKNEDGEQVSVDTISVYDEILRDAGGLSDVTVTDVEEPEEEEIVFEWEKTPAE